MPKVTLLTAAALFLMQCSGSGNRPTSPGGGNIPPNPNPISGITVTNEVGFIINSDVDDWCFDFDQYPLDGQPDEFAFHPAFPNPVYEQAVFEYDVPVTGDVRLKIIDTLGETVRDLAYGNHLAGRYVMSWNRRDNNGDEVAAGLYRSLMTADSFECHGDVKVISHYGDMSPVVLNYNNAGSRCRVSYQSDFPLSRLYMVFYVPDAIESIEYDDVTDGMIIDRAASTRPGFYRIVIHEDELATYPVQLPAAPGGQMLCTLTQTRDIKLVFAYAFDGTGYILLPTEIKY